MTNRSSMQTTAVIRYLLVIHELDKDESGARSVDIAARLQVTKPSVHTMLKALVRKNFVAREKYEAVHLTAEGRALTEKYAQCYELLCKKLIRALQLPLEDCRNVACAVLSETTEERLPWLFEKLCSSPCKDCTWKNQEFANV